MPKRSAAVKLGRGKDSETRQRILDATANVLAQKGYSGTRLSDISSLAKVHASNVYYYFPSREALVAEVVAAGTRLTREHVERALADLPQGTLPTERIIVAVEAHLRLSLEISAYAMASIRNMGQLPAPIRQIQLKEQRRYGTLWRNLLGDAQAAGEIPPVLDLGVARMLVLGALNWAPEWWDPRRGSLETVIRTAQTMIRNGLSAPIESSQAAVPAVRR